jgi:hypothetical protein
MVKALYEFMDNAGGQHLGKDCENKMVVSLIVFIFA